MRIGTRLAIYVVPLVATLSAAEPPEGLFLETGGAGEPKVLEWRGHGYALRGVTPRGWTSLSVGGDEFLRSGKEFGGILHRRGDTWATRYTDAGTIAHDNWVGRQGSFSDGVHLLKISPEWNRSAFELYAGHNDSADEQVVVFLSSDVLAVRCHDDQNRAGMQAMVCPGSEKGLKTRTAVVVHRSGRALRVTSRRSPGKDDKGRDLPPPEFEVGNMKDPAGQAALALVFHCKGFAANAWTFEPEPEPNPANLAVTPLFDVRSSDDPKENVLGPAGGVRNPLYTAATRIDFGVTFGWLGKDRFRGTVEIETIHALGRRDWCERKEVHSEPDAKGRYRVTFAPEFQQPGVHDLWARLIGPDGKLIWMDRYRMGWEIMKYKPAIVIEKDFAVFWDATLKELRAQELAPETKENAALAGHPDWEFHNVTFAGWQGKRVHALLYVPRKRNGPLPAMVTAHPGTRGWGLNKGPDGVFGSKVKQDPRFVTIVPLIRGHAPDATDISFNHPWWGPLEDRDTYVARAWYCTLVRAVDYLATRPDWVDMKRVVAAGGSQGGAFALVTAALDPRIAACFADCPANGQPQEILLNYASFGPSAGIVPPGRTVEDTIKLLSYYNPVNFCPRIRCMTHVGSNIGDLTVHSMGPLAAYHNLTGLQDNQKAFHPGFTHFHGSGPGLGEAKKVYFGKLANGVAEKE